MRPLNESPFSYHFLALRNLGSWLHDAKSEGQLNLYIFYRFMVTLGELIGVSGLVLDLYMVLGDIKKMSWNLCITTLLIGLIYKNWEMIRRRKTINRLRLWLHRDAESRNNPEHISINNHALKELKIFRISFYGGALIFIPTWIVARYIGFFYGAKELPIPFLVPPFLDLEDDVQFHIAYFVLGFGATFGLMITIEAELARYGLMIQISREYKILVNDIPLVNGLYIDEDCEEISTNLTDNNSRLASYFTKKEVNPWLKKLKTKMLVKRFCERQMTLIHYVEAFEVSFNRCFLQQFFGITILIITLALQCLWESVDLTGNIVYQMGYLSINIMDMFMTCLLSTRLRNQCLEVGETIYSSLWYRMSGELQKDIGMMILRSQHPPRLTIGKFKEVDLGAFMNVMMNVYSWLALFRQLE